MAKKTYSQEFLAAIQQHVARVAITASAARRQGAPGIVQAAREYLAVLPLGEFGVSEGKIFGVRLDEKTELLRRALPNQGNSWGLAKKLLNIFLRDALYTVYLREHFRLELAELYFEIPLDSITAKELRRASGGQLPLWAGVRHLTPQVSQQYQTTAAEIALTRRIARVHLDAYWWAGTRK